MNASNDRAFPGAQFQRMSDTQCQRNHWASLEVMERTGVRLYEQEAIDPITRAGAHPEPSYGDMAEAVHAIVERAGAQ